MRRRTVDERYGLPINPRVTRVQADGNGNAAPTVLENVNCQQRAPRNRFGIEAQVVVNPRQRGIHRRCQRRGSGWCCAIAQHTVFIDWKDHPPVGGRRLRARAGPTRRPHYRRRHHGRSIHDRSPRADGYRAESGKQCYDERRVQAADHAAACGNPGVSPVVTFSSADDSTPMDRIAALSIRVAKRRQRSRRRSGGMPSARAMSRSRALMTRTFCGPMRSSCFCAADSSSSRSSA